MRLTTKGQYAVTAMLDVAVHSEAGHVPLVDVSRRQDISLSYLEQLFALLRKQGLVHSARGPGGGYKLSRPAAEVNIADIVNTVETVIAPRRKNRGDSPEVTEQLWDSLSQQLNVYMGGITLEHVIQGNKALAKADGLCRCYEQDHKRRRA